MKTQKRSISIQTILLLLFLFLSSQTVAVAQIDKIANFFGQLDSTKLVALQKQIKLASTNLNKCVNNADNKSNNYNNIELHGCEFKGQATKWYYLNNQFRAANFPNKCIDVKNHGTANGTNIRIWDCMEHNEQRWVYDALTKQLRYFKNPAKCMEAEIPGVNGAGARTSIKIMSCDRNNSNQKFKLLPSAYRFTD